MDPFVIVLITLLALGGGAGGGAVALARRRQRKRAMGVAILDKVDHHGRALSIFDVFWDLGVSDYALALMDNQGLLLDEPEDFERAHARLDDLIEAHGTYTDLIEDNLAAIQEFYREHRQTGHRRKIPTMTLRQRKFLPVARSQSDKTANEPSTELTTRSDEPPVSVEEKEARADIERDLGRVTQDSVEERRQYREQRSPLMMTVTPDEQMSTASKSSSKQAVDLDELVKLEPLEMLKNIFDGRLTEQVQKWWKFRHLRGAKSKLDDEFQRFYAFYADLARSRGDFYDMLYDTAKRWREESRRIDELAKDKPWSGEPFSDCAQSLVEQAAQVARELAGRARYNVDATVERIHDFARQGDDAMAGYLLYLNHHAFFAGRAPDYVDHVQKIERLAYRVQEELRKLRRDGEI